MVVVVFDDDEVLLGDDELAVIRGGVDLHAGNLLEVAAHRQMRKQARFLEHVADPPAVLRHEQAGLGVEEEERAVGGGADEPAEALAQPELRPLLAAIVLLLDGPAEPQRAVTEAIAKAADGPYARHRTSAASPAAPTTTPSSCGSTAGGTSTTSTTPASAGTTAGTSPPSTQATARPRSR